MSWSPRHKQDAVIAMAIIVVVLALWRLHSRPRQLGRIGSWAGTNIFGPATLSLFPGAEPAEDGSGPPAGTGGEPSPVFNTPPSIRSNGVAAGSNQPPAIESAPFSSQMLSTNLLNTNGPVTVIAVTPSELVETPAGVISASNVAESSAMERRLGEVSAKGGDIQISLFWKNYNDLDLHCIDPPGEEIYYSHKRSGRSGGELDVDQNASAPYNNSPVENIYWPAGGAPPGLYRVSVVHYANHGGKDPTAFTVRTVVQGRTNFFSSTISYTERKAPKPICALQYDPANADPSRRFRFLP